ncbi:hypothetical protein EDB85DRAFT_1902458 [Lactarius pseudohatsudake]|nr:hypothetical protein EDB85DRAFT_1902458 [Lactarius pseudohatsudake]
MPRKNTYTIPMGDVVEVVAETRRTARGLRTIVKEVPFHSKTGQAKSGQASHSQSRVEPTIDQVQSQSFRRPSRGEEESHTLQPMEPYENDMPAIQMEDTQPQASVYTDESMDRYPKQISPPIARDGGSDKCSEVLRVYQINADQVFRLYWGQLLLQRTVAFDLICGPHSIGCPAGLFWMTSWLITWNARQLHNSTIPNFKASPNRMFPHHVPNLYKQLLRASRQWRDLKNRIQSGLGHQNGGIPATDGSMAIFCPACPQPGINLPDDWKIRNQLIRTFIMDGNFSAEHMRCRTGETDVPLSSGMAFMANPNSYKAHLHSGQEVSQASGATACCHGFFVPTSVVDFQKGESICKALSYNMEDIPVALVMYDIMCQYGVHFQQRVERSPELSLSDSLQLRTGIGLFHIHGHQDSCLPRFSPSYIPGAKQVDGEIIETLWAPLNNVSRSIRGMSLAHRQEVLDAHMNHSNWKKMVRIVPSLLKRWKRMDTGIDLSADILDTLNTRFKTKTKRWLKAAKHAQSSRHEDPTVMDIYDTMTSKAPSRAVIQQQLISEESGDITTHGQTSWIACGIKIQELQLAIRYQLRAHGLKITTEEIQVIENKRSRLQTLIDIFEHQGDSFLLQPLTDDSPISPLGDYAQYDHLEDLTNSEDTDDDHLEHGSCHAPLRAIDGSGMDGTNPEDFLVLLPSSLGWEWCVRHGIQSLAGKEVQLRHAQASESIHEIRLALGFKSALFRTQVRPANSQQTKTRAWNAVHSVDTNVREHARIYSMARDACQKLRKAIPIPQDLPKLHSKDLCVETLVLGSEQTGQRNKQQSWIWGFGDIIEDDGTWMDDFERVHWLRARAQFERWSEEQHSIHNEAKWIPAYFHAKAETWKKLMIASTQDALKGHQAYASYQMHAWEELSRSSVKALTPITDSPLKHCEIK